MMEATSFVHRCGGVVEVFALLHGYAVNQRVLQRSVLNIFTCINLVYYLSVVHRVFVKCQNVHIRVFMLLWENFQLGLHIQHLTNFMLCPLIWDELPNFEDPFGLL